MNEYIEDYRVEAGVVYARLTGTFPNERLAFKTNLFEPLIEACRKNDCIAAIVDARELQVNFDTVALFRAGVDAAAMTAFGLCVALVAREDMVSPFFDDVIRNRGARVDVFTDMEAARDWIDQRLKIPGSTPTAGLTPR